MNQQELNKLYASFDNEEDQFDLFYEAVGKLGGVDVTVFDYVENSDVGGVAGLDDLFDMMKKHGFTVLEDPMFDSESGNLGWIVFPPA